MKSALILCLCVFTNNVFANKYLCSNVTEDPSVRQLPEFRMRHPKPIGVTTMNAGQPVELRHAMIVNSDLMLSTLFFDMQSHNDGERIPMRIVHGKGVAARGYFEVTNDVSKYTKAKVFNGIGKKTPVLVRFSTGTQERGGTDLARDLKGFAAKFYTEDGNLDLLGLQVPVYMYKDPIHFSAFVHAFQKSRSAGMVDDNTARWDFICSIPTAIHVFLWLFSDYGLPDGYRKMDSFPGHTYVLANDKGEQHYVKFNFRTEQGLANLTSEQAAAIQGRDMDYFNRDLYNAIEKKNYPSWRLEMDVLTKHDILHVGYNPFDLTVLWKNGTYKTVTIGRLVMTENSDNNFRDAEASAFNPANLVPGIPGPVDLIFKSRLFAYKDAPNHRIGRNHDRILANSPKYMKTYNRDSQPPQDENMNDVPAYYPNSFSGPVPYVDDTNPKKTLQILDVNAVDLQEPADFYNYRVTDERHRERLASNIVESLDGVEAKVTARVVKLMYLVDHDLGHRVESRLLNRNACRA